MGKTGVMKKIAALFGVFSIVVKEKCMMLKKIGSICLVLVVVIGMLIGGKAYVDREKAGFVAQMAQEKAELMAEINQKEAEISRAIVAINQKFNRDHLVEVLGSEGALMMMSDGKFDSAHDLVDLAGSDKNDLKKLERKILVEAYTQEGKLLFLQPEPVMAWIYDQDLVITHPFAFYIITDFGLLPLLEIDDIVLKTYLLPDPNQEPDLAENDIKEPLGEITFNPELNIVVIKRINPTIGTSRVQYLGEYTFEELTGGEAIYQLIQDENRIEFRPLHIQGTYTDKEGRNLIYVPDLPAIGDLGGLVFGIRDGRFELIGLTSIIDFEKGKIYAIDILQVQAYVAAKFKGEAQLPEENVYLP